MTSDTATDWSDIINMNVLYGVRLRVSLNTTYNAKGSKSLSAVFRAVSFFCNQTNSKNLTNILLRMPWTNRDELFILKLNFIMETSNS